MEEKIKKYVEKLIVDPQHFLVDVKVSASQGPSKITVLLDGDNGINISDCASISRQLAAWIEEEDLMSTAYTLDVSSPGLDQPLVLHRQYVKNVGRNLKVTDTEGNTTKGKLTVVEKEHIIIEQEIGKNKKKEIHQVKFEFDQIQKALVMVSFK